MSTPPPLFNTDLAYWQSALTQDGFACYATISDGYVVAHRSWGTQPRVECCARFKDDAEAEKTLIDAGWFKKPRDKGFIFTRSLEVD